MPDQITTDRRRARRVLTMGASALAVVGIIVVGTVAAGNRPHVARAGHLFVGLLEPAAGQCAALLRAGGDPDADGYAVTVATRTARALTSLQGEGAITAWHAFAAAGAAGGCGVHVHLTRGQAQAWAEKVDAADAASVVRDARLASRPAWAVVAGRRPAVLAGEDPAAADTETDPTPVADADAGP